MDKKKAIIWGAGGTGRKVAKIVQDKYEIVGFVDNDKTKWKDNINGITIYEPDYLKIAKYDIIILGSLMGYNEIQNQILQMGIPFDKIREDYVGNSVSSRIIFLKRFAESVYENNIKGSVGEAGVFRGEFAKKINEFFPNRKCYLFDTFDGFAEEDIRCEQEESLVLANYMKGLSDQLVYEKMPYKKNIIISKGYFPDTAIKMNITDNFCFINLDMDLYKPIYEGISFFYPKMSIGGCILIHDYFSDSYPNVKKALEAYESKNHINLAKMPIGDDMSIAIIKI